MYARAARCAAILLPGTCRLCQTDRPDSATSGFTCPYCGRRFDKPGGRGRHVNLDVICRFRHDLTTSGQNVRKRQRSDEDVPNAEPGEAEPTLKRACIEVDTPPVAGPLNLPLGATPVNRRAYPTNQTRCESVGLFVETFPISTAGAPIGAERIGKENLQEYLQSCGRLGDPDLFRTAKILMTTGLTGAGRTEHLQGPMYTDKGKGKGKAIWWNDRELLQDIDSLPRGPKWTQAQVTVGEGIFKRRHTVRFRDVLEVIRHLISARRFKDCMRYAPERHWTSPDKKSQLYDEMWSGDWWWRMQFRIRNEFGTVVPLIVASDETRLTKSPNGPKAHPVYLSIGNISKAVQSKPTKHAMLLLGYLPVDPYNDVPDDFTRQRYYGKLLHRSLAKIFEPLETASSEGIFARCADGYIRHLYPILASYIADWPEQNCLACTTESGCPKCLQKRAGRGQGGSHASLRNQARTIAAIRAYQHDKRRAHLAPLDLRPYIPFWAKLPYVKFGSCLTPDLLHQLYKGMYEHARNWVEILLGTKELNQRFMAMPGAKDLRRFKSGVTNVKVWTGRESRDMMRQFLPVAVDTQAPPDLARMLRSLLDFSYLAHSTQLSDTELTEMETLLATFHKTKRALVDAKIVGKIGAFDRLAKLHMLSHYTHDIRELGVPDGYSTEMPEHLHIVYVKTPWRMSSRRDPLPQMEAFVERLEAIRMQRTIIDEFYGEREGADKDEIRRFARADRAAENEDDESTIEDKEDMEDEDVGDGADNVEVEGDTELPKPERLYYPRPAVSVAREPTVRHVSAHVLKTCYGASDFTRALGFFLSTKSDARSPLESLSSLHPSDRFDVWHKATLKHGRLPFAPTQPCHRDVVRAQPPVRNSANRVTKPGVFDTALFACDPIAHGLNRYRAGRVRAIFSLPRRLQHIHSGPLVYLQYFQPFEPDPTNLHCLFRTAPVPGPRASMVVPLHWLGMTCHLAPDFSSPPSPATVRKRLLFNEYYNHSTYLLMAYWRRIASA
ncbi:Zn-finger protein [Ceratobasidium sp. AG-Ba]|nr:Zn-finger protein [Ceratobasidium sp. AG-Ba]QRV97645.1 Zn-finger protein [Ceratobasidium sp. AG-Ba]